MQSVSYTCIIFFQDLTDVFKEIPWFHVVHSDATRTQGYVTSYERMTATLNMFFKYSGIYFTFNRCPRDFGNRGMSNEIISLPVISQC